VACGPGEFDARPRFDLANAICVDIIRRLGAAGYQVVASDTFSAGPGSQSRYATAARITASPRRSPLRFVDDVAAIMERDRIECLIPACEEAIYLAALSHRLPDAAHVYPSFDVIARLHEQGCRARHCAARECWFRAASSSKIRRIWRRPHPLGSYFANPFIRDAGFLFHKRRAHASAAIPLEECDPSIERPWIVRSISMGSTSAPAPYSGGSGDGNSSTSTRAKWSTRTALYSDRSTIDALLFAQPGAGRRLSRPAVVRLPSIRRGLVL
jgi:hypothetical protein